VKQSRKTFLIWLILIGMFLLLYRLFDGPSTGLTRDKLVWIGGGAAAAGVFLFAALALYVRLLVPAERMNRYRDMAIIAFAAATGLGGTLALVVGAVSDTRWHMVVPPFTIAALILYVALRAAIAGRARRRLCIRLRNERTRELAEQAIALEKRESDPTAKNELAVALEQAGFLREAQAILEQILPKVFGDRATVIACNLAYVRLIAGDPDGAGNALAHAPQPSAPAVLAYRDLTRARLLARTDRAAEALPLVDAIVVPPRQPDLSIRRDLVRAEVLAAMGDRPGARALLAGVPRENLELFARVDGPAAELAREVLAGGGAPFR
jgi:hypothetical protein